MTSTTQLNPGGSPEATRRAFNKPFLLDLAEDWQQHGREVFKRVRRESPAAYLKVCAMLVPREMKLEHSGGVKAMTDEQLEQTLAVLKELIAQRDAGQNAKVIDGVPEPVPALPPPSRKARRKARRSDRADSGLAARVVGTDSADGYAFLQHRRLAATARKKKNRRTPASANFARRTSRHP